MGLFKRLVERVKAREEANNLRAGLISSMILNVNRSKSTDKVWTPVDFFPKERKELVPQTDEQMYKTLNLWVDMTKAN